MHRLGQLCEFFRCSSSCSWQSVWFKRGTFAFMVIGSNKLMSVWLQKVIHGRKMSPSYVCSITMSNSYQLDVTKLLSSPISLSPFCFVNILSRYMINRTYFFTKNVFRSKWFEMNIFIEWLISIAWRKQHSDFSQKVFYEGRLFEYICTFFKKSWFIPT